MDWTRTFVEAAGTAADPAHPFDGESLLPLFADPAWNPGRPLFWRMKHRAQRAMIDGDWKYLEMDGHRYLFNVTQDPRERANLRDRQPQRLQAMMERWRAWDASLPPIPDDAKVSLVFGEQDLPRATF